MDYFTRQMKERKHLYGIWFYWFNWYRVRRADWQTRLWLEELREWKREIKKWEKPSEHLDRAEVIAKNVDAVETGMLWIRRELDETRQEARKRDWHVRFPRPQVTMNGWIRRIIRRYRSLNRWIDEIRKELPILWKSFVYVIYYAYTTPGAERHLEAHLEGQCYKNESVQAKVKMLANKLLRLWVAKPVTTKTGEAVGTGYAVPLLLADMAKPPYEGRRRVSNAEWEWGVQWEAALNYNVVEERIEKTEPEAGTREQIKLIFEIFDYDYAKLRAYSEFLVPARWWEIPQEELEKMVQGG